MTDEQYETLRRHILDLKSEVAELKLLLKKQNEIADHRFALLYEWCAPAEYKAAVDAIGDVQAAEIPDDIKKLLDL